MKSPDNAGDPAAAKYLPRIFYDVADAAVRASGDDEKPFPGPAYDGRVIQDAIRHFFPVQENGSGAGTFFKRVRSWNLA